MSDGRLPRRRRWIGVVIAAAVLLLALAVGWVLVRGVGAADHLKGISAVAEEIETKIAEGEVDRIPALADRIDAHAETARELTADPVWRAFEFLPALGPGLTAVRETAEIADDVAGDAVQPLAAIVAEVDLSDLGPSGARVDLTPFAEIEEPLRGAAEALASAAERTQHVDAPSALPPFADAVRGLRETMTRSAGLVGALHGASALLPSMLGQEEPRTYVVVVMDNAELRAQGGVARGMLVVRATNGLVDVIGVASSADMPGLAEALPLSEEVVALWGDAPGRDIRDTASIPDFADAGPIIAQMWQQRWGYPVDGVIAVDATVVADLVGATGPVTAGPLALDADTARGVLLSEIAALVPSPSAQDAAFARAAMAVVDQALVADAAATLGALADAADERRIRIWSAHEAEQRLLAATTFGGGLPQDVEDVPAVAVLVDDRTDAKMDYYAHADVAVEYGACRGEATTRVSVTWTNDAPADAATALPPSVTGGGAADGEGVPPGETETLLTLVGPQDAAVSAHDRDEVDVQSAVIDDRPVRQFTVRLAPGESTTVSATFTGDGAGERLTRVLHTPMGGPTDVAVQPIDCGR